MFPKESLEGKSEAVRQDLFQLFTHSVEPGGSTNATGKVGETNAKHTASNSVLAHTKQLIKIMKVPLFSFYLETSDLEK